MSLLEYENLREEELISTCHGVQVHGDGLQLGDGDVGPRFGPVTNFQEDAWNVPS